MGITPASDLKSEMDFSSDEIVKILHSVCVEDFKAHEIFTDRQLRMIIYIANCMTSKMLLDYNDMDVAYNLKPDQESPSPES